MGRGLSLAGLVLLGACGACTGAPPPTALDLSGPAALATYGTPAGDSLRLLSDGSYLARPAAGNPDRVTIAGQRARFWVVGRWELGQSTLCAQPNYAPGGLRCGAVQQDRRLLDQGSIFLRDGVPREWSTN